MHMHARNFTPDGLIDELDLGGFSPVTVAEYPPGRGVAFGSADGKILLVDQHAVMSFGAAQSEEAINGLAFLDPWIAISTRSEIVFVDRPREGAITVPYGAHGVVVGPDARFWAPLGTRGLLHFDPAEGNVLPVNVLQPREQELYFYRLAAIAARDGRQAIVAAARRDGIAAMSLDSSARGLHTLTFEAFDAVDVCPLEESSLSVAALGKDGTILMCRDVIEETLKRQASATVRFPDVRGTAYRILNAMGNLVVITSRAFYILGDLVTNFLQHLGGAATILEFPIQAIDACVIDQHLLLIITSRAVLRLDLRKLQGDRPRQGGQQRRSTQPAALSPVWQGRDVPQLASH